MIPPGSPWYNPATPQYPYDPARARALLDGLGYRAGADGMREMPQGGPLTIDFLADPAAADIEIIRIMPREVGLAVLPLVADT